MLWNKNEGDILEEIIWEALPHVDSLFIADDGSTDLSWPIIQSMQHQYKYKIEHIQREPNPADKAQRQSLLNQIRKKYKPEDTIVQIIESDIMILDTDIRKAFKERSNNIYLDWIAVNASREGKSGWNGVDVYPNWKEPIKSIMTDAHYMEIMTYTFRPFKELYYEGPWRPWPKGFSNFSTEKKTNSDYTPLLAHYGFRGPTHFYLKYRHHGKHHPRYKTWDLTSPETVANTVFYFNGIWNRDTFSVTREGWKKRKHDKEELALMGEGK